MSDAYPVSAVRTQIGRYVLGEIDREHLEGWLFLLVWSEDGGKAAIDLAWTAELLLMEASRGHLSERELRANLLPLAHLYLDGCGLELSRPA